MKFSKRTLAFLASAVVLILFIVFSCDDNLISSEDNSDIISDNPVTITWFEQEADLEGYMADVDVFAMNSRRDTGAEPIDSYRISIKQINGRMYTRVDSNQPDVLGCLRSIVSDGAEIVMFDSVTEAIDFRFSIDSSVPRELNFFSMRQCSAR